MYSYEDRKKAVELYIKYDRSAASTVRELGYPDRKMLAHWYKEYIETGELHERSRKKSKFTEEQMRVAVHYYLEHGKNIARTVSGRLDFLPKKRLGFGLMKWSPKNEKVA